MSDEAHNSQVHSYSIVAFVDDGVDALLISGSHHSSKRVGPVDSDVWLLVAVAETSG